MWDILKKYKKHKKFSNIAIVFTSLILAISINLFIIDSTTINKHIKTSLLESKIQNNISDIFMKVSKNNKTVELFTSKDINDITNINMSFLYNPDTISINSIVCNINSTSNLNSDNNWISSVIIDFEKNTSFQKNEKICDINIDKKSKNTEQLIIEKISFFDKNSNTYEPSVSSLSF